jgi:hypothetical protein
MLAAFVLGVSPVPRVWADGPAANGAGGRADSLATGAPGAGPIDSLASSAGPSAAPPDSGEASGIREVGARRTPTVPLSQVPRFERPRWVMMRSLVLPGWGQFHNRAWFKAIGVAAGEGSLIAAILNDERQLDRLKRKSDDAQRANDEGAFNTAVLAYNDRLASSTNRRWWLGGVLAYALLDAYVDAHFIHFEAEFDTDPALPEGSDGKSGSKPGAKPGGKLSLRWKF